MVRFWRIVGALAISLCTADHSRRKDMDDKLDELNKEIGADSNKMKISDDRTEEIVDVAFVFSSAQHPSLWKKISRREHLYLATEKNVKVREAVKEVLAIQHSNIELFNVLEITEREYKRADGVPRIIHEGTGVFYFKTSPFYNGNEQVERVSDLDMEALFPELATFDESEDDRQENPDSSGLMELLKEALSEGTARVVGVPMPSPDDSEYGHDLPDRDEN